MRARIGSVELEGTPEEIGVAVQRIVGDNTPSPVSGPPIQVEVHREKQHRHRKKLAEVPADYIKAAELVRTGTSTKDAIQQIFGREMNDMDYYYVRKVLGKGIRKARKYHPRIVDSDYWQKLEVVAKYVMKGQPIKHAWTHEFSRMIGGTDYTNIRKVIARLSSGQKETGQSSKKKTKHFSQDHKDFLRKRLEFVNSRAKSLMGQYQYSWEKALSMASMEWSEHNKKKKIVTATATQIPAPVILQDPTTNKILLDMIRNMCQNKGELKLHPDGEAIGLHKIREWEELTWKIIFQTKDIMDYLGIKGHLKFEDANGERKVIYHD